MSDDNSFLPTSGTPIYEFRGSKRKWQRLTEDERELAISLERIEADDLSIHLYNAHALKKRLTRAEHRDGPKYYEGKVRWITPNVKEWRPSLQWTAWPLEPEFVPRQRESFDRHAGDEDDAKSYVTRTDHFSNPSEELKDILLGETVAAARARFTERPYDSPFSGDDQDVLQCMDRRTDYESRNTTSSDCGVRPVVLADDEVSREILMPSVQHVLSRLDELLLGLHKSRKNYTCGDPPEHEAEVAKKTAHGSGIPAISTVQDDVPFHNRSGLQQNHANPRDWSEILGMASLKGWDALVMQKAKLRCEKVFDEHMYFRVLHEAEPDNQSFEMSHDQPAERGTANGALNMSSADSQSKLAVRFDDLVCPYPGCALAKKKFAKRFRFREHLKRAHGHGNASEETARVGRRGSHDPQEAEEKYGGVHTDGFMQPILARPGWANRKRPK